MKTRAIIEKGVDGKYCIFTPDIISTIIGEGTTIEEAKVDFENSVKEAWDILKDEVNVEDIRDMEFVYLLSDEVKEPF